MTTYNLGTTLPDQTKRGFRFGFTFGFKLDSDLDYDLDYDWELLTSPFLLDG